VLATSKARASLPLPLFSVPDPVKASILKNLGYLKLAPKLQLLVLGRMLFVCYWVSSCHCFLSSRASWQSSSSLKAKLPCSGCLAAAQGQLQGYRSVSGAVVELGKSDLKVLQALQMTAWTDLLVGREAG